MRVALAHSWGERERDRDRDKEREREREFAFVYNIYMCTWSSVRTYVV